MKPGKPGSRNNPNLKKGRAYRVIHAKKQGIFKKLRERKK